jgi:hypothetical protein
MPTPMPEQGPVARPRSKPAEPKVEPAAPQVALVPSPAERRMLAAVEELHASTLEMGLPPQSITIGQRNGTSLSIDPEAISTLQRVDQRLADLDAMALGPQPLSLHSVMPPADPDAFLVRGFIRPGTTVMLTGPPGSSKSWAARQLAIACGAGLAQYLERYQVARPMNVLIVDEDNGPDEEWRREETLLTHLGLERRQMTRVQRTSLAGVQLDHPTWQAWLRGLIFHDELDLVVLDPISEMHGGKELREDPAFRTLLGFLKRLKVDFPRLATLLVHHTRKADVKAGSQPRTVDDVRGQWGQTPDVVALMWRLPERRVSWELHKRVPHSKLILEATQSGPLQVLADESTQRDKLISRDDRVLQAIEAGAEDWEQIQHVTGTSKTSIFNAIKSLRQAGVITARAPYSVVFDPTDDEISADPEEPA